MLRRKKQKNNSNYPWHLAELPSYRQANLPFACCRNKQRSFVKDRWYYIFVRLEPLQFNHPYAIFVIPTTEISSFLFTSCEYVESRDIRIGTIAYNERVCSNLSKNLSRFYRSQRSYKYRRKNIVEFSNRSTERFSRIVIAIRSWVSLTLNRFALEQL